MTFMCKDLGSAWLLALYTARISKLGCPKCTWSWLIGGGGSGLVDCSIGIRTFVLEYCMAHGSGRDLRGVLENGLEVSLCRHTLHVPRCVSAEADASQLIFDH